MSRRVFFPEEMRALAHLCEVLDADSAAERPEEADDGIRLRGPLVVSDVNGPIGVLVDELWGNWGFRPVDEEETS